MQSLIWICSQLVNVVATTKTFMCMWDAVFTVSLFLLSFQFFPQQHFLSKFRAFRRGSDLRAHPKLSLAFPPSVELAWGQPCLWTPSWSSWSLPPEKWTPWVRNAASIFFPFQSWGKGFWKEWGGWYYIYIYYIYISYMQYIYTHICICIYVYM